MADPWLSIPLTDYEGHMRSDSVRQLDVLAEIFGDVLEHARPASVAILGAAGGNGLERIDPSSTRRTIAVDINPAYLEAIGQRFGGMPGLELHRVDLRAEAVSLPAVSLVHAALIFEHAGLDRCLETAIRLVEPGGILSVVLQLPSQSEPGVAATPYPSIQKLSDHFSLVDPSSLCETLAGHGFGLVSEQRYALPRGKAFWAAMFR
jgi:hypothetical protein